MLGTESHCGSKKGKEEGGEVGANWAISACCFSPKEGGDGVKKSENDAEWSVNVCANQRISMS